eukprot:Sspe_Gene.72470::Locus_43278_Transcript_1_1_Confidence_1.000_Length_1994::g.72470::m.72470/K05196/GLRB; glycine receptor beta
MGRQVVPLLPALLGAVLVASCSGSGGYSKEEKLVKQLLDGYNPDFPPRELPVKVYLMNTITKVADINTKLQTYAVNLFFRQQWHDERLEWNASEHGFQELIYSSPPALKRSPTPHRPPLSLSPETIWVPDVFFANSLNIQGNGEQYLFVFSSGNVVWSRRFLVTFYCQMDFGLFPFDEQNCTVSIESYAFSPKTLVITIPDNDTEHLYPPLELNSDEFDVASVGEYHLTVPPARQRPRVMGNLTFTAVKLDFIFTRNFKTYFITVFAPLWLVVALSCMGLWLDNQSAPARVSMGVSTVLILITLLYTLTQRLPEVSYILALDLYLILCLFTVFCNSAEYTVVNYMQTKMRMREDDLELRRRAAAAINQSHPKKVTGKPPDNPIPLVFPDSRAFSAGDNVCVWFEGAWHRALIIAMGKQTVDVRWEDGSESCAVPLSLVSNAEGPPPDSPLADTKTGKAALLSPSEGSTSKENDPPMSPRGQKISKKELADLKELFAMFDKDKNSTLCREELSPMLEAMGMSPTDVQRLYELGDQNKDGRIDQQEFIHLLHGQLRLIHGSARSVTCLCFAVSRGKLHNFERIYRTASPSLFVLLTGIWFGVVFAVQ